MKINTKRAIIAATAMISIGCGGTTAVSTDYHAYDAPAIDESLKQEYLKAVNDARAVGRECGVYGYMPAVPPLAWSDELYRAAYEHSEDLAESNTFSHTGSGTETDWTSQVLELGRGSTSVERGMNNGYPNTFIGENISAERPELETVMHDWLGSEGHCHNIMYDKYTKIGMIRVEASSADWHYYWTQDFGGK